MEDWDRGIVYSVPDSETESSEVDSGSETDSDATELLYSEEEKDNDAPDVFASDDDGDDGGAPDAIAADDDDYGVPPPRKWYEEGIKTATRKQKSNFYSTYQAQPPDDGYQMLYNTEIPEIEKRERRDRWEKRRRYRRLKDMGREGRTDFWHEYVQEARERAGKSVDASFDSLKKRQARFMQAIRNNDHETVEKLAPYLSQ